MRSRAIDISDFDILKKYTNIYDETVALLSDTTSVPNLPLKVNWVIITFICNGHAVCRINDTKYVIGVNNMMICMPGHIVHIESSTPDFRISSLCISRDMLDRKATFTPQSWAMMDFIFINPVIDLEEENRNVFESYYNLLTLKLTAGKKLYYKEGIHTILQAFIYDLHGILEPLISNENFEYSSGKLLFMRFLKTLSEVYPKPRNVEFYSGKLNVTSKYLSSVCKVYSEKTASAIINQLVIKDIEFLLTYSSKSIKEIMIELDFPSLSFFGKYVKKHLGMGPKEFRNRKNIKEKI